MRGGQQEYHRVAKEGWMHNRSGLRLLLSEDGVSEVVHYLPSFSRH